MDNALRKAKHEAELKKLAATTVNVMTTTGGTTNTTNPSGGGSSGGSSGGGTSSGGGIIPPDDRYKAEMKALSKAGVPDSKQFIPLKLDDDYATWLKGFLNTAALQGFKNLLDPLYIPSSSEEQKIFDLRVRNISTTFSPRSYLHLKVLISYVIMSVILMHRRFSVNYTHIKLTLSLPHVVNENVWK